MASICSKVKPVVCATCSLSNPIANKFWTISILPSALPSTKPLAIPLASPLIVITTLEAEVQYADAINRR